MEKLAGEGREASIEKLDPNPVWFHGETRSTAHRAQELGGHPSATLMLGSHHYSTVRVRIGENVRKSYA